MPWNRVATNAPVEVASRTYNKCVNIMEQEFGISVPEETRPSVRFQKAIMKVKGLGQQPRDDLDDYSVNDIKEVFREVIDEWNAKHAKTGWESTREDIVRSVVERLQDEYGFRGGRRLGFRGRGGVAAELMGYFNWLFREYADALEHSGNGPQGIVETKD